MIFGLETRLFGAVGVLGLAAALSFLSAAAGGLALADRAGPEVPNRGALPQQVHFSRDTQLALNLTAAQAQQQQMTASPPAAAAQLPWLRDPSTALALAVCVLAGALAVCCLQIVLMKRQLSQMAAARSPAESDAGKRASTAGSEAVGDELGSQPLPSAAASTPADQGTLAVACGQQRRQAGPRSVDLPTPRFFRAPPGAAAPGPLKAALEQVAEQRPAEDSAMAAAASPKQSCEFVSPFYAAAAARRSTFFQSESLSPPCSGSPRAGRRGGKPPRAPGMGSKASSFTNLASMASQSQLSGDASASVWAAAMAAATAAVHGTTTPPGDPATPSLLTPYASGCCSGMFERQLSSLPELMQLIQAYHQDAADSAAPHGDGSSCLLTTSNGSVSRCSTSSASDHVLLSGEGLGLPMRLIHSLVDPAQVSYLHGPDGRLDQLGAGASSRVYKALFNGEVIAAKEIDIGSSPEMREAFVTEALLLQGLRHPNLVGFFGISLTASRGVLLIEHCEGRDLHTALPLLAAGTSERLFGWRRRGRRVAYEVAKAVNYLHSRGVTHMDIKSGNVLLTAAGEARLSDVGLSRHQALNGSAATGPRCIGTFAWMAPELLLDADEACTPAIDIYSYGVLLWEIITGERPLRGRLRRPMVPKECPQGVSDLLMRCLAQEPSKRPTAPDLLRELGLMLLQRAFASDRATTTLSGCHTGSVADPAAAKENATRSSIDGMPLRTLKLEPCGSGGGGIRRSVSFNYPLLADARKGFGEARTAADLLGTSPSATSPRPDQQRAPPQADTLSFW